MFTSLSIPVPWDFSMHLIAFQFPLLGIFPCTFEQHDFQFPFLGIFPCTELTVVLDCCTSSFNSRSWDFSMHLIMSMTWIQSSFCNFQFPFLGIFPCTSMFLRRGCLCILSIPVPWDFSMQNPRDQTFNSRSLGFFHAPLPNINYPFFGPFHALLSNITFNSRSLGFFHCTVYGIFLFPFWILNFGNHYHFRTFQFPFLGIFPCIII